MYLVILFYQLNKTELCLALTWQVDVICLKEKTEVSQEKKNWRRLQVD